MLSIIAAVRNQLGMNKIFVQALREYTHTIPMNSLLLIITLQMAAKNFLKTMGQL